MQTELPAEQLGAPDLEEAWSAYERGDFRSARSLGRASTGAPDPHTASAARELLRRTGVDPAQVAVLIACALSFAWAVWTYVL